MQKAHCQGQTGLVRMSALRKPLTEMLQDPTEPVGDTVDSAYGTRYAVDGPLETPDGRNPLVRTVWIVDKGSARPRLITAHPLEGPQ